MTSSGLLLRLFAHLLCGLLLACRAFTFIMGEVHRPLRLYGQRMTYLIDGSLYAPSGHATGKNHPCDPHGLGFECQCASVSCASALQGKDRRPRRS